MRTQKRTLVAACGILLLTALAIPAVAQGFRPPPGHGAHGDGHPRGDGPPPFDRMLEILDLTDAQREQIEALRVQQAEATEPLRAEMKAAHENLAAVMHAESFDEPAIREAAAEASRVQTELMVSRARGFQTMREILTPEQLAELQQAKELMRKMRPERTRRGHGERRPAPPSGQS